MRGEKVFTKTNLMSTYHQVVIKEEDIHKIGFKIRYDHYEFVVLEIL
jgi:hypothetical protein